MRSRKDEIIVNFLQISINLIQTTQNSLKTFSINLNLKNAKFTISKSHQELDFKSILSNVLETIIPMPETLLKDNFTKIFTKSKILKSFQNRFKIFQNRNRRKRTIDEDQR